MHLLSQLRGRDESRVSELRRRAGGAAEASIPPPPLGAGLFPSPACGGGEGGGLRSGRHDEAERVCRQVELRDLRTVGSKDPEVIAVLEKIDRPPVDRNPDRVER